MASLYFYQYNNYYNRQVKQEETISDYGTPVYIETGNNLNFNPSDGVMTRYVAGRAGNPYSGTADYVIYSEDNINFTSRWFIIEQSRSLKGQYNVTLRRDVLVDYYSQILNARTFIEKATLPDSSALIYNDEGITVNQIKTAQTPLYDDTGCGWVVGYVDRKYNRYKEDGTEIPFADQQTIHFTGEIVADESYSSLSAYPYNIYRTKSVGKSVTSYNYRLYAYIKDTAFGFNETLLCNYRFGDSGVSVSPINVYDTLTYVSTFAETAVRGLFHTIDYNTVQEYAPIYITDTYDTSTYNEVLAQDGKVIYDESTDHYYRVSVVSAGDRFYRIKSGNLYNYINTILKNTNYYQGGDVYAEFNLSYLDSVYLRFDLIQRGNYRAQITSERYTLRDAPYDMFCIPYGGKVINRTTTSLAYSFDLDISKSLALTVAQGIQQQLGASCYDIQILPYCPITSYVMTSDGKIDVTGHIKYAQRMTLVVTDGEETSETKAVLLWAVSSSSSKSITITRRADNIKISNQCDMYRLVSPNFNGQYEFNISKNNGFLDRLVIDYTYLPYQPFIRVSPSFAGLYGKSFQDARGLICGGNFSATQISDTWTNYVNSNKNYNNIFDRQIENMDVNRKYQKVEQIIGMGSSAIGQGVKTGMQTGNALAGIASGALSLGGGIADLAISDALYSEEVDYKRDMFGYQLDNVKAMPNSIAKTTGYNQINTIVPILEYYTCTEEEKTAVANKIAWNGMTVMAIGKVQDYIGNTWSYGDIESQGYIKGRLIRIEDIDDDFHLVNAISDELYKGAYYK